MANTTRNKPGVERITNEDYNPLDNIQVTYEKNKSRINTGLTIVVVAIVGFFGYKKFIQEPKQNKAATAISYAQAYFAQDSLN
jgi:predicted negative regulator of RcsB-dependent stress response